MYTAEHTMQHQLEHELWLKELEFLHDEIEIMKHHLSDVYYRDSEEDVMQLVADFDNKFSMQKEWLETMKNELEQFEEPENLDAVGVILKKSFRLQMQANRIVNEELKNSFLKLFS
jgi:hypothetical protein